MKKILHEHNHDQPQKAKQSLRPCRKTNPDELKPSQMRETHQHKLFYIPHQLNLR